MAADTSDILLLGGGFLGGRFRERFSRGRRCVTALSSRECDLRNARATADALRNLAGRTHVVLCGVVNRRVRDDFGAMKDNAAMAENVARGAAGAARGAIASIVYLSSVDVYGPAPSLPITERTPVAPGGYYALSKYCGERIVRIASPEVPVLSLRLPGVYGQRDGGRSVVGALVARIREGLPVVVHGRGDVLRDYVHADDVARLLESHFDDPRDGLWNVATGRSRTFLEIVGAVGRVLGVEPALARGEMDPPAAGDLAFDTAALRAAFPDAVFRPLEEGVAEYVRSAERGAA